MPTPSYADRISQRTKLGNLFRWFFTNRTLEKMVARQTRKSMQSICWRLVPRDYQYKRDPKRAFLKYGVNYDLLIDDMLDHAFYFGSINQAWENFISLIDKNFTVIDAGANIGLVSLPLARKLSSGKVYSYEPSLKNFTRLQRNISLNNFENIVAIRKGLGACEEKEKLFEVERHNSGMKRVLLQPEENLSFEEIEIVTLDREIATRKIGRVDAIKIDVEGFELNVLKGAQQTIVSNKPTILIEVIDRNLKLNGHRAVMIFNFLTTHGYILFDANRLTEVSAVDEFAELDMLAVHPSSTHWSTFQRTFVLS